MNITDKIDVYINGLFEAEIKDYKLKNVAGLHAYKHYEAKSGDYVQIKDDKIFYAVHVDKDGERKEFDSLEDLKKFIKSKR